ncbi:MAG: aminoacyl-tRNA hydrolase [Dissulfurispiraceae bacterium]|jgi:peptidyl-tRNA hydrolase, PTH1 family
MWVIAGLGNPGEKYAATRHNIGFMVLDRLSETLCAPFIIREDYSLAKGSIDNVNVTLLKPLTYMNLSGFAVKKVLKKSNLLRDGEITNLIVIHDDLDLETGVVKIRRDGSSGGHRGIESIIRETGSKDFIRVKVGIGRDREIPVEEYVLRRFKSAEKKMLEDGILKAMHAVEIIISVGIEKAMNVCNRAVKA